MKTFPEEWVYVGNLPFSVTEEELRTKVEEVAKVKEVDLVIDEESGRFRGFGYVHLYSPEEATEVAQRLHGQPFGGRQLFVIRYDEAIRLGELEEEE